ncbi:BatA domain-containing protein [Tenacibaculum piscium]|uniref:BatA domain-containing protein n=1 Tax=Tenacibaculum piscium TaxID=1458515 RepID=UPI001F1D10E1|nr:BatA domain-containing protein [Tenacibaculum piscium]
MQFKHPEILYFLAVLLIPILIHLFQFQKFVKVPFTNVAFLKKIALQTRKSSRLKKWLILATRLLLLTAIIFAFAQPYFGNHKESENSYVSIYLDNSLSTNTQGEKGDLLQVSIQEIMENLSKKTTYSLLTNADFYKNKTATELKSILVNIKNTAKKTDIKTVLLKISSENKQHKNTKNTLISDFQNVKISDVNSLPKNTTFVKLTPVLKNNISIDSVYLSQGKNATTNIHIVIRNQGKYKEEIPISLYKQQELNNKQMFTVDENKTTTVIFSILKSAEFSGKIQVDYNDAYAFDNTFYFCINSNPKMAVLNIRETKNTDFLNRIYTSNEFYLTTSSVQNLNYNLLEKQELIIVNEIEKISEILAKSLVDYSKKGGNLVIIPAKNATISSYNTLFKKLQIGRIISEKKDTLKITNINYKHPILKNVFEKEIQNFQYPYVKKQYKTNFKNSSTILNFENKNAFIQQINTNNSAIFWVASSLDSQNSNFINSPLIVPIFYNIAKKSRKQPQLYYRINTKNSINIGIHKNNSIKKSEVLQISNTETSFIPLQKTRQNNIEITTINQPLQAGFYQIKQQNNILKNIAFNYPKQESSLNFLDIRNIEELKNKTISNSVENTLQNSNQESKIQWLWKWFLALAIVSLLTEIFILKFFKT